MKKYKEIKNIQDAEKLQKFLLHESHVISEIVNYNAGGKQIWRISVLGRCTHPEREECDDDPDFLVCTVCGDQILAP